MTQLARDTGISRDGLTTALSSEGNPSFATILKVTRALGLTQARRARRVQRRLTQSHMRNVTAALQPSFLNSDQPETVGGSGS